MMICSCTIDWFGSWPSDALEAIAMKQLKQMQDLDDSTRKILVGLCQAMHTQVWACFEAVLPLDTAIRAELAC
jgi:dynein heavy chain